MSSAFLRHGLIRDALALILIPVAVWFGIVVISGVGSTMLLTAVAGAAAIGIARSRIQKNILLIMLTIIVTMGVCEVALRIRGGDHYIAADWGRGRVQRHTVQDFRLDPDYGFDAIPNVVTEVSSYLNDKQIYDVTYSFDAKGARITPGAVPEAKPILIVGDSYNFGEGLNDNQTLGYYLQKDSRGTLRALNLARPGYGPHQVLRQLELHLPSAHGVKSFDWLVISMIDDHIERANGTYAWSLGPRYVFDGEGGMRYDGQFGNHEPEPAWLTRLREGSKLFTEVEQMGRRLMSEDDQRFIAILRAAREQAMRQYGARTLVLYYSGGIYLNEYVGRRDRIRKLLEQAGVDCIDVNKMLPVRDGGYFIQTDGHPTEKLNAALAGIILRKIGHPEF